MQKTLASLLVTLAASVLAIAAAYIVGVRSAEYRIRQDVTLAEERQRELVEQLRRDLAPRAGDVDAPNADAAQPVSAPVIAEAGVVPMEVKADVQPARVETPEIESAQTKEAPAEEMPEPAPATEVIHTAAANAETIGTGSAELDSAEPTEPTPLVEPTVESAQPVAIASETADVPAPAPIARESFDAVSLGASYADVAQKFGRDGHAALTMEDAGGTETKQYLWQWTGPAGEHCRVDMRFVNGKLIDKAYRDK